MRRVLAAERDCEPCRAAIVRDAVVIYQPSMWPARLAESAREFPAGWMRTAYLQRLQSFVRENATYSPLVRFVLLDAARRSFRIERRSFRGDEGWLSVTCAMAEPESASACSRCCRTHLRAPRRR